MARPACLSGRALACATAKVSPSDAAVVRSRYQSESIPPGCIGVWPSSNSWWPAMSTTHCAARAGRRRVRAAEGCDAGARRDT
jgi:hypothetical protein